MNAAQLQAYIRFLNTESQPGPLGDAYFGPSGGGPIIGVECLNVRSFGAVGDGVTDDTAAITSAVATVNAVSANYQPLLCWPAGVYLTTASIPNFHAIYHGGPGIVQRGSDLFHISPNNTQTNTIYAAISAGLAANDGLSASQPVATLQQGIDTLTHWGPYLTGTWAIQLTAETFARGRFPDLGLRSSVPIQINGVDVGGHPNVPTTIVSESANGTSGIGLYFQNHTDVQVSDVKFIGFNGSSSSAGIDANNRCEVYTINCHIHNCTFGIQGLQWTLIDVKGGIFDVCGYKPDTTAYSTGAAIQGVFHCKFSVGLQGAGDLNSGPILQNNSFGGFAQENTTGHFDWVTVDSNVTGLRLVLSSRMNIDGVSLTSNTEAISLRQSSHVSPSANTVFGTGASANTINISTSGDYEVVNYMLDSVVHSSSKRHCIARFITNQLIQTTGSTVFYSITLPAQLWVDLHSSGVVMKSIHVVIYATLAGTNNTKNIQIRFGNASTSAAVQFAATDTGVCVVEGDVLIGNNPIGTQLCTLQGFRDNSASGGRASQQVTTVDMTADTVFGLEARVANALDSVTINAYEVYIDGL